MSFRTEILAALADDASLADGNARHRSALR